MFKVSIGVQYSFYESKLSIEGFLHCGRMREDSIPKGLSRLLHDLRSNIHSGPYQSVGNSLLRRVPSEVLGRSRRGNRPLFPFEPQERRQGPPVTDVTRAAGSGDARRCHV